MNKKVFNQLVKTPSNISSEYKNDLKKLVDTFPYSANIRLLYLSSLLNDADVLFEQELKKTAAYISDRKVLRRIITKTPPKESYIIKEPKLEVIPKETDGNNSRIEVISNEQNIIINQQEIEAKKIIDSTNNSKIKQKKSNNSNTNEKDAENTQEINQETNRKKASKSINELDNLIISSAIDSSIYIDIDEFSDKKNEENLKENKTKSFLEWIKASEIKEIKPEIGPKQKERIEFKERAELLINQFIENQPKIKPKAEFYSAENMARKSIKDSEDIVTETLAKVYAAQGNIAKAKSIYNQLILKNPEKKSYFASLIKDLSSE